MNLDGVSRLRQHTCQTLPANRLVEGDTSDPSRPVAFVYSTYTAHTPMHEKMKIAVDPVTRKITYYQHWLRMTHELQNASKRIHEILHRLAYM